MLALLRTISEIMGSPPTKAETVLPTPTASMSRSMSVFRCHGSIWSTAFALSNDSRLPIRANMITYLMPMDVVSPEKSGNVSALNIFAGTSTRNFAPNA